MSELFGLIGINKIACGWNDKILYMSGLEAKKMQKIHLLSITHH